MRADTDIRKALLHRRASLLHGENALSDLSPPELRELRRVVEALYRLDQHAYGKCIYCGHAIERSRLRALPWASQCARCVAAATTATARQGRSA